MKENGIDVWYSGGIKDMKVTVLKYAKSIPEYIHYLRMFRQDNLANRLESDFSQRTDEKTVIPIYPALLKGSTKELPEHDFYRGKELCLVNPQQLYSDYQYCMVNTKI